MKIRQQKRGCHMISKCFKIPKHPGSAREREREREKERHKVRGQRGL